MHEHAYIHTFSSHHTCDAVNGFVHSPMTHPSAAQSTFKWPIFLVQKSRLAITLHRAFVHALAGWSRGFFVRFQDQNSRMTNEAMTATQNRNSNSEPNKFHRLSRWTRTTSVCCKRAPFISFTFSYRNAYNNSLFTSETNAHIQTETHTHTHTHT